MLMRRPTAPLTPPTPDSAQQQKCVRLAMVSPIRHLLPVDMSDETFQQRIRN
jgi:hypothetical protein